MAIRLPATKDVAQTGCSGLRTQGAEVVNLVFDRHGRERAGTNPRHMRDVLREAHQALVKERIRDEVTLMASGGIALPEHMAKAIICGADLVTDRHSARDCHGMQAVRRVRAGGTLSG